MKYTRWAPPGTFSKETYTRIEFDVSYEKPGFWEDIAENQGWGLVGSQLNQLVPLAFPLLPCIIPLDMGRTEKEKDRIRKAYRQISVNLAALVGRWRRYAKFPEGRNDAIDSFQDDLQRSKWAWGPYECSLWEKIQRKDTKH